MIQKIFSLLLFCSILANLIYAQEPINQPDFVENELLIWLEPNAKASDFSSKLDEFGLRPIRPLSKSLNIWLFSYTKRGVNTAEHFSDLRSNPLVKFVQNNHYIELRSPNFTSPPPPVTPNDTHYSQQWGMDKIKMPEVWGDYSTGGTTPLGEKIVVAVIDNAFDLDHPDLNFWVNANEIPNDGLDNDNNGYVDDYEGWDAFNSDGFPGTTNFSLGSHATLVSGVIGAKGNNSTGVTGVNWDVEVMPIRINSSIVTEAHAVEAYTYAYDMRLRYNNSLGLRGAYVVATNASFGINFGQPSAFPIWCGMFDILGSVGILNCGAAPNIEANVETAGDIPTRCTSNYLIGVTNINSNDIKVNPAGYGTTSIDIAAPGGHPSSNDKIFSSAGDDTYDSDWGASFATPHVTGTIALMYAAACQDLIELYDDHPAEVALLMKKFLLDGADQLASLTGFVNNERRLNALGAMEYLRGVQVAPLDPTLTINSSQTWSDGMVAFGNITVKSGYTLTIEDVLIMPKSGKITVEKGAKLVIDGGRITTGSPSCIGFWQGIEVIGDPNLTQSAANQGTVELTNAIIEYANEAIYTGAGGNGWQGGAIVQANGTTFRNNRRAVAFLQYNQSNNLSYFDQCTFEINGDYPQSTYIDMVTMWDVQGIDFTDCIFTNTNSAVGNTKRAIYTLDANFDISNGSSFSGFEGAVFSTNSNTINAFSIDGNIFSDNAVGVYAGSVDNINVNTNTFTIGQYNTSTYNHGLFLEESTGYQVEDNQFIGDDQVSGGMDLIGVECQNSGDDYNELYNNDFSDLYYGVRAFGDNRGNTFFNVLGLTFICNSHADNTYDFRVDKDNSISASLSGIAPSQGIYFQSAGNTFSLNSTPTGSDFYNDTPNSIYYYYDNGVGKKPLNIFNVGLPGFASTAHGCASQTSMMASSNSNEEQFLSSQAAYEVALSNYQKNIDDGKTDDLIEKIISTDRSSSNELYENLLNISPWISVDVMLKILDQVDLFTHEQIANLFLANPDLRKEGFLWEKLAEQINLDQIKELKLEMSEQPTTTRSEREDALLQYYTEMQVAANALIKDAIFTEEVDLSTARKWLGKKDNLKAIYAIVESWLQEQKPDQALSVLNQIPSKVKLQHHQEVEYKDYKAITELKTRALQSERTIADFSKEEVQTLVQLADRNNGRAGVQARGILNFFYGYEYAPHESQSIDTEKRQSSLPNLPVNEVANPERESLISVFPNPANQIISFSYKLNDYTNQRVVLQIFDESGRNIKEIVLDPISVRTQLNISQFETGIYIYQLKTQAKIISSGQFIISR